HGAIGRDATVRDRADHVPDGLECWIAFRGAGRPLRPRAPQRQQLRRQGLPPGSHPRYPCAPSMEPFSPISQRRSTGLRRRDAYARIPAPALDEKKEKLMYQPRQPLIELSPRLASKRLSEVELGQLLLAGEAASGIGIALRGDVLTERGEIIEGLFRLYDDLVSFERRELGARVVAI